MNSSSEPRPSGCYPPLEYREADEPAVPAAAVTNKLSEATPGSEELFAVRLEEARRTLSAQLRQEFQREIRKTREGIGRAIEEFSRQREQYFHEVQSEVVDLALAIARHILHRESQIDPRLLAGLVNYELEQLETATSVRLFVSPDEFEDWTKIVPVMPHTVELAFDKALTAGEVRVETELGSTTISFERELKEVERGFLDLLSHRPSTSEAPSVQVQ
jgi:flagellar assembly protein FliH